MPNLRISISGEEYTREAQVLMWDEIHVLGKCPECHNMATMYDGPSHGRALNKICRSCHTVFWTSPLRQFGAYPVSRAKTTKHPSTGAITFIGTTEAFKAT